MRDQASTSINMFLLPLSLVLTIFHQVSAQSKMVHLRLTFPEEQPPGTIIGDIKSILRLQKQRDDLDFNKFMFNPLNYNEKYFDVNRETGLISMRNRVDRERLCDELGTCCPGENPSCKMTLTIALIQKDYPSMFKEILTIDAEIIDINDNSPSWNIKVYKVEIPEHTPITTKHRLPIATDPDKAPENTTRRYQLLNNRDNFAIDMTNNRDPAIPPELFLQLTGDLDREKQSYYELHLNAIDGGMVPRTGAVIINVTLLDINDHSPKWKHDTRRIIEIPENYLRNREIFRLQATDEDSNDVNNLVYKFSVSAAENLLQMFSINPRTGSIVAIQNLDYESKKDYKLPVIVTDGKNIVETVVTIKLTNENDNPPRILVKNYKGTSGFEIKENSNIGSVVAIIDVTDDDDKDRIQEMSCFVDPSKQFGILPLYDKAKQQFKMISNIKFDREQQAHYTATITCNDNGSPNKHDSSSIHISILDENDNAPVFLQNPMSVRLKENNNIHPNQFVARMEARDNDTGENALIRYSIDHMSQQYFTIDYRSGVLKARVSFDREQDHFINVTVYARDLGNQDNPTGAKTATGTVLIEIEDQNDCAPEFHPNKYTFTILENVNRRSRVGQVHATDRDVDQKNRNIVFRMYSEDGSTESRISYSDFLVTRDGEILTNTDNLDREQRENYQFLVIADDQAGKSDTAQVTVEILDENDNSPKWIFPSDSNKKINVSVHETTGYKIAQLHATDPDKGLNQSIIYKLETGNPSQDLFKVSPEGDLYLARPIDISKDTKVLHKLLLNASDRGNPPRYSIRGLDILITETSKNYISSSRTAENNLIIIICMVVITMVISLFLIAAIFFLRCNNCAEWFRPRNGQNKRFQQNQYASAHSFSAAGGPVVCGTLSRAAADVYGDQYKVQLPLSPLDCDKRNMIVNTEGKVLLDDNDSLDSGKGCSSDNGTTRCIAGDHPATLNRATVKIPRDSSVPMGIDSKQRTISFTSHAHSRSNPAQTMSTFRYSSERITDGDHSSPSRSANHNSAYQNLREATKLDTINGGSKLDGCYTTLQRDDSGHMLNMQQRVQSPVQRGGNSNTYRYQPTSFV